MNALILIIGMSTALLPCDELWQPDHIGTAMGGSLPGFMTVDSDETFEVIFTASDKDAWKRLCQGTWQYKEFGSTVHKGEKVSTQSGATVSYSQISFNEGTYTYSHVITAHHVDTGFVFAYDSYQAIDYNTNSIHKDTTQGFGHTVKIVAVAPPVGGEDPGDPPL